jgi:hypothetical protein
MYTACVFEQDGLSPSQIHERAFAEVRSVLGDKKVIEYSDSSNFYRRSLASSPEKFCAQLPFYNVKPLYVWILRAGYFFGISPILFSTYINLVCYVLISFIILSFLITRHGIILGALGSFCGVLMPMVLDTLKNNTPDMLAALFLVLAIICLLLERPLYYIPLIFFSVLLVLVRMEFSLLFILIAGYLLTNFKGQMPGRILWIWLSVTVCTYVFVIVHSHLPGWGLLYRHTFLGYIPDLSNAPHSVSFIEYLKGFKMIPRSIFFSDFSFIIFLIALSFFVPHNAKTRSTMLLRCVLIFICIRILLFPDLASRFYAGILLIVMILFYETVVRKLVSVKEHESLGSKGL